MIAYAEDLVGLTPEQLDAACTKARQTSEFMPVSAAILKAHQDLQAPLYQGVFLGPPQLTYREVTQEEREDALKFSKQVRAHFKAPAEPTKPAEPAKKKLAIVPSKLTIEEQKAELKRRGLL